jgi:iron complex outermembrane recepter protein
MINFSNSRRSSASMLQIFNKTLLKGLSLGLGLAMLVPASAQDSEKGISSLMEEVVVTARKREESVQDTPIAVSAFTGDSLDARGIQSIDALDSITPNMEFRNINTNGGGGSNASVYIRGVGQTDFVPSADPGVGVYVDGVYIARSIGAVLDLVDVDRVEVLRGPQGTLFGRNTTGGAISIHSQKPHEEFGGKLRVRTGSNDRLDVIGKVNGALAENVFASLTMASLNQDGYVVNPDTGLDVGDTEKMAGRAALRWLVNDDIEINIAGDYTRVRENGQAAVSTLDPNRVVLLEPGSGGFNHNFLTGPLGPPINNPGVTPFVRTRNDCDGVPGSAASLGGTLPSCANSSTVGLGTNNSTLPTFFDADIWGVSGTIEWDINDNIKVKSITAYRDLESEFAHDGDASPFNLSWVRDFYEQSQFSQEIQIQGVAFDDRLNWIFGGYYFEEDGLNYNPVDFANIDIESGGFFDHNSKAVFAQGTFDVTEKLHVTAGIRYTKDTKDFIVKDFVFTGSAGITTPGQFVVLQSAQPTFAPPGFVLRLVNPDTYTLKADDWTPMINVAYDWNDELMTYATYSEGFKSGGVQQRIAGPTGIAPTYDPEFVESYEVGFKYNNEAGNFTLNMSAFYVDYSDIQLETIDPNGGIAPQLQNSGVGEVKGVELEMRWSPMESWFVETAVGHLDTEITEADATQVGGPAVGDRFPLVSKWSGAIAVIKELDLGTRGTFTPRVDYSYRTKVLFSPDNNPRNVMKSYGMMNASIGWISSDDKYSLDLRVDNIFDKYIVNYSDQSPSSATQLDLLARDRQWTLMGEYRF